MDDAPYLIPAHCPQSIDIELLISEYDLEIDLDGMEAQ